MNPESLFPDLKAIKPTVDPAPFPWVWAVGIVVGVLIVIGLFFYFKRNPRLKKSLSPQEEAQKGLDQLHLAKCDTPQEIRQYYSQLSLIARKYLHRQFDVPAEEMTTDELIYEIDRWTGLSDERKRILKAFFAESDLVKFAGQVPEAAHARKNEGLMRTVIQNDF